MNDQSEQLERIVAYLDGELSAEESAQVEARLASDEQFRQQLQGAERAWAALDGLPMATVGDKFSRTTMEMVVDAARQDVEAKTLAMPIVSKKSRYKTALLVLTAALLGAVVFRVVSQAPNRRLLADLPVIQNVDIYSQFRSVSFLAELHRRMGNDLEATPIEKEHLQAKVQEFRQVASVESRENWLTLLPADEQVTLRAKLNRFHDLSPKRQADMRELHQEIEASKQSEQLLQTMFRYQQWLVGVPQSKQYEYRELSDSDRAERVAAQMRQAAREQQFELSTEQIAQLLKRVRPHIQQVTKKNRENFEKGFDRLSKRDQKRFREMSKQEQMMFSFHSAMRVSREGPPEGMQELNALIAAALPPEMSQAFEELSPWKKAFLFRGWIRQARSQAANDRRPGLRRRPGEISEQELSNFFVNDLEPDVKERLLALPRDKMTQQLQRLYRGQMSGVEQRRPAAWDGRSQGRPGFGRPNGPPEGRGREGHENRRGPHGPPPQGRTREGRRPEGGERRPPVPPPSTSAARE